MLFDFVSIKDGHLGLDNIARHRIELSPADEKPIHPAPYQAWSKERELDKKKMGRMLPQSFQAV